MGKQGESGTNMEKREETRQTQGKQENTQKHMKNSIYIGDMLWSLT